MEIQLFSFFCVIPAIAIFTNFIFISIVVSLFLVKQTYLPTQHLTLNLTLNQNSSYGPFHRKTLPTSLLHKRRGLQLRFSRGANLDRSLRFYRSQILLWSTTLLNEGLARTFSGGCSLRAISPNMCRVLHLARHPLFLLDTTIRKKFSLVVSLDLLP